MNIYSFEIKSQLKTFIIWTLSILVVFLLFMSGLFNVFMQSKDAISKVYSGLPPTFAAAFGIVISKLFSYGGFFQFIFSYIALIGAIMASSVSVAAFSREKRSKCVDFLLAKPVSRGRIFIAKLLSNLSLVLVTNILFVIVSMIVYSGNGQDPARTGRLILASCSLFLTQLVFISIGIIYATFAKKVRSVSGIATALGFGGFILSALVSILNEEAVRFVAPLMYFQPYPVFSTGRFETKYAVTAVVVIIVCTGLSYLKFCKTDTPAD